MPSGFSYLNSFDRPISYIRSVRLVFIVIMFVEISALNANSVDPDQTPRYAASDLGLHCLPMSHLWKRDKATMFNRQLQSVFFFIKCPL